MPFFLLDCLSVSPFMTTTTKRLLYELWDLHIGNHHAYRGFFLKFKQRAICWPPHSVYVKFSLACLIHCRHYQHRTPNCLCVLVCLSLCVFVQLISSFPTCLAMTFWLALHSIVFPNSLMAQNDCYKFDDRPLSFSLIAHPNITKLLGFFFSLSEDCHHLMSQQIVPNSFNCPHISIGCLTNNIGNNLLQPFITNVSDVVFIINLLFEDDWHTIGASVFSWC